MPDFKSLKLKVTPAFVASLAITVLISTAITFLPKESDRDSYLAACKDKMELLRSKSNHRIITLGGSNVALGLDSAFLSEILKRPVVNMGSCFQIGLNSMLNELKPEIHSGDTVVLIPEYELWTDYFYGTRDQLKLFSIMPQSVSWIVPSYFAPKLRADQLLENYLSNVRERVNCSFTGESRSKIYSKKSFDKNGDFTSHLDLPGKKFDDNYIPFQRINRDSMRVVEDFTDYAKQHGAEVLIIPPITTKSFALENNEKLSQFYSELKASVHSKVVTDFNRYAFSGIGFYDCMYHPKRQLRKLRTSLVAEDIQNLEVSM